MQEFVFFITGKVKKPLTIDPSVWIFDERKIDLKKSFDETLLTSEEPHLNTYTKAISAQWDKEITEGATPPNPNRDTNRISYDRDSLETGSFAMPLAPFFQKASPHDNATNIEIETHTEEKWTFTREQAMQLVAAFCENGKPLKEDGPIHLYIADGITRAPIRHVARISFI
ncbi:peptidyl-prolyl cis-trans isomerase [Bacillus sp. FSL W7-1360]